MEAEAEKGMKTADERNRIRRIYFLKKGREREKRR